MTTVRIDDELSAALDMLAERAGISKSELVRRCLREYVESDRGSASAWELGKHLFGRYGSGETDRATRRRSIIREKLHPKKRPD